VIYAIYVLILDTVDNLIFHLIYIIKLIEPLELTEGFFQVLIATENQKW